MHRLHEHGEVLSTEHTDAGTAVHARVAAGLASELAAYAATSG
jgi:GTP-binding protein HflX